MTSATRGGWDAVGTADRLRRRVADELGAVLAAGPVGVGRVHVGWVAARDVAGCAARYRGQGEDGWGFPGWSPATAAGAVARAALLAYLDDHERPGSGAAPPPAPLGTVRQWMRSCRDLSADGVAGWVAERRDDGDAAVLAATAAGASRWLAGFLRVMGWPLPADLGLLNAGQGTLTWRPAGVAGVSVSGGADARLGRVSGAGRFSLVVHRPAGGDDGAVEVRATFEAAAGALARGIAPEAVLVTAGDTGERLRLAVDDDVLAAGGGLVVDVVRQRVIATERGFDPADATPGAACRHCERALECPPGQAWLHGPGHARGGLPVGA
ncbi:MAG TPA: hypothetical protein VFB94_06360 [Acidimicrobiales bacterium]|nr:hypothetical protein [Acidimicrobiales bacterium]